MEEINSGGCEPPAGNDPPGCRTRLVMAEDDSEGVGQRGPEHRLALRPEGEDRRPDRGRIGLQASAFGLQQNPMQRRLRSPSPARERKSLHRLCPGPRSAELRVVHIEVFSKYGRIVTRADRARVSCEIWNIAQHAQENRVRPVQSVGRLGIAVVLRSG